MSPAEELLGNTYNKKEISRKCTESNAKTSSFQQEYKTTDRLNRQHRVPVVGHAWDRMQTATLIADRQGSSDCRYAHAVFSDVA
jgi:hypothetical protein